jgi:hypothetical protein
LQVETAVQIPSTPEMSKLVTQPVLEEVVDTLSVETVESVIETVICESVNTSAIIEETGGSIRDSTFLTEIEDIEEIQLDNITEKAETLDQLENSIAESENEFPIEEQIGAIEEAIPSIVESIKEKGTLEVSSLPDVPSENTELLNEQTQELQEMTNVPKESIVNEIEVSEPFNTDINEDIFGIPAKETEVTDSEAAGPVLTKEITEKEQDVIDDKAPINIATEDIDTKEAENIPILTLFMIVYVVFMALFVFCH